LLRLLSILSLLSAVHAVVETPCKAKQTIGCDDLATSESCKKIFVDELGQIAPSCYDATNPDFVFSSNCRKTCQLCCQEPQFDCDDEPLPGINCPTADVRPHVLTICLSLTAPPSKTPGICALPIPKSWYSVRRRVECVSRKTVRMLLP
ncbi:hypothetical protein PENTCL1PPCAC_24502, partial [Pristionchus entomophagus]